MYSVKRLWCDVCTRFSVKKVHGKPWANIAIQTNFIIYILFSNMYAIVPGRVNQRSLDLSTLELGKNLLGNPQGFFLVKHFCLFYLNQIHSYFVLKIKQKVCQAVFCHYSNQPLKSKDVSAGRRYDSCYHGNSVIVVTMVTQLVCRLHIPKLLPCFFSACC